MKYVVYCDESRHDGAPDNRYMAIGGLWLPRSIKPKLTEEFRRLLKEANINAEAKWSKVSAKSLEAYQRIVQFFFEHPEIKFRVIVVEQARLDTDRFHKGDRELGFYKFYYQMLMPWVLQGNEYLILLDYQKNKGSDRYQTLRRVLDNKLKGTAWISDLTVINSRETPLAQLADILTGAVAACWCGNPPDTAKAKLAEFIALKGNMSSLRTISPSPGQSKINIFRIHLK